jgi:hypothetical protein
MWEDELKAECEVIYINAWAEDFDDSPIISIVSALLDSIGDGQEKSEVKEALTAALGVSVAIGGQFLKHISGIDVPAAVKVAENELSDGDVIKLGLETYNEYNYKKNAYEHLRKSLTKYAMTQSRPLIIFIDELDRARPDYSVKFLEAIKHIFPIKGICFVLAVDREQLQHSVGQLYGPIDFDNYYRRFVTREVQLPEVSSLDLIPFVKFLGQEFFDKKRASGLKFPFKSSDQAGIVECIAEVCKGLKLRPREIEAVFRIISQFMLVSHNAFRPVDHWVDATILMIVLSIKKPTVYRELGNRRFSTKAFRLLAGEIASSFGENKVREYLILLLSFYASSDSTHELSFLADELLEFDARERGDVTGRAEMIGGFRQVIGRQISSEPGFKRIYKALEEWNSFIT